MLLPQKSFDGVPIQTLLSTNEIQRRRLLVNTSLKLLELVK